VERDLDGAGEGNDVDAASDEGAASDREVEMERDAKILERFSATLTPLRALMAAMLTYHSFGVQKSG